MTNEEAIDVLKDIYGGASHEAINTSNDKYARILLADCEAITMAIEALEKQSRYDKLMQIVVDSECMVDWACCDLTENIIEENGESWCTNHCTHFRKECVEKWIDWSKDNDDL